MSGARAETADSRDRAAALAVIITRVVLLSGLVALALAVTVD